MRPGSFASFSLALALFSPGVALSAVSKPAAPRPWLKTKVEEAKALATKKVAPGSPQEARWQEETKAMIDGLLDWDELIQRSLGTEWEKRTPEEQKAFGRLLREMIESSYRSKLQMAARGDMKKPAKITIEWLDEQMKNDRATVSARVKADKKEAVLSFELLWKNDRWRAYDLSIDDVSTVRTYRSQFRKLIAEKGWSGLMERLAGKIEEIRAGRGNFAP